MEKGEELNIEDLFGTGKLGYASENDLKGFEMTYIGFLDRWRHNDAGLA